MDRGLPVTELDSRAKDPLSWVIEGARDRLSITVDLLKMMPIRQAVAEKKLVLIG
jgi:hypothetical protein